MKPFLFNRPGTKARKAFTLIEIMLVMVIIGIMTGAVLTNSQHGYQCVALDSDAGALADFVVASQEYVRLHNIPCQMVIDTKESHYYLAPVTENSRTYSAIKGDLGAGFSLSNGVDFGDVQANRNSRGNIQFYPNGRADSAVVTLKAGTGGEKTVEIQSLFSRPIIR
jgi:prepilin-type N-terminal cleavage/methylation domain-containing protein